MKDTLTPEATARSTEPQEFHSISLKVHDVSQLFNSMDPSPFLEKDLDDDAENFIVSWAREFPLDEPLKLRIHLENWPAENPASMIEQAVHNHFAHRAELSNLEFRALMKQGRFSLLIGLSSLAFCLALSKALLGAENGTWPSILREGLTIAGWVAMWRPMEIYLYDWWPVRRRSRIYVKLSQVPIEVLHNG
jgi:hypothetical protein